MAELREDFTMKDWVVFATERAKRPHETAADSAADRPLSGQSAQDASGG
jgi:hypothetical protein